MKLTKEEIQQIIKEEIEALGEQEMGDLGVRKRVGGFSKRSDDAHDERMKDVEIIVKNLDPKVKEKEGILLPSTHPRNDAFATGAYACTDKQFKDIMKSCNNAIIKKVVEIANTHFKKTTQALIQFQQATEVFQQFLDAGVSVNLTAIKRVAEDPESNELFLAAYGPYMEVASSVFGIAAGYNMFGMAYRNACRFVMTKLPRLQPAGTHASSDKEKFLNVDFHVGGPVGKQRQYLEDPKQVTKGEQPMFYKSKVYKSIAANDFELRNDVFDAVKARMVDVIEKRFDLASDKILPKIIKNYKAIKSQAPDTKAQVAQADISQLAMASGGDQQAAPGSLGPNESLKLTKSELQRIIQEELENIIKGN